MSGVLAVILDEEGREAVANRLFELGAGGVEERDAGLWGWFAAGHDMPAAQREMERYLAALAAMGQVAGAWEIRVEQVVDEDWQAGWKAHWRQQDVGRRLSICPSWIEPAGGDRRVLRLDPGSAFGTGTHESTLLLLEWLDDLAGEGGEAGLAGRNVLDAGCGTGILALAALALGAPFALGIDIDAGAVAVARENARANGRAVSAHFRADDPRRLGPEYHFELVLANIQRSVIEECFHDLLRVTAPGGLLLLAGLLETEEEAMRALAAEWRLPEPELRRKGEWIAMGLVRPPELEV